MNVIAIDPGMSGGFAWISSDKIVRTCPMPETLDQQVSFIRDTLHATSPGVERVMIVMERVGGYRPGNSGPASVKFARHCGNLEAICFCLGKDAAFIQVAPQTWMKSLGIMPKEKTERKNKIKEMMAQRYSHIKVTLKVADALGILTWALEKK